MRNPLFGKHVLSMNDLPLPVIETVLERAKFWKNKKHEGPEPLKGKILAALFFEPSTRTRLSFESAMIRLGGQVIGFSDPNATSASKGESLYDSIRVISSYADAIVIRHPLEGSATLSAEASLIPVINAGDGSHQHPTQTLLDLFTIQECFGTLSGLKIVIVGDLKYGRTVHSLAIALSLFDSRIYFVAPEGLTLPDHIAHEIRKRGANFSFHYSLQEVAKEADVIYMTRLQKERLTAQEASSTAFEKFSLNENILSKLKPTAKILHPLPRVHEIPQIVDETPFAHYFTQAANGVFVREALLEMIMNKEVC